MMRGMSRSIVSLVALMWLSGGSASAQPIAAPGSQQEKADALFEEGRKLLGENDATGACEKFNQAIQLDPTAAGTMLNLGLCNQNLGKFKTALYWFRKAQARATETNLPDHEKAARLHTTEL